MGRKRREEAINDGELIVDSPEEQSQPEVVETPEPVEASPPAQPHELSRIIINDLMDAIIDIHKALIELKELLDKPKRKAPMLAQSVDEARIPPGEPDASLVCLRIGIPHGRDAVVQPAAVSLDNHAVNQ